MKAEPLWITLFNQFNLPSAVPFFDLFFANDCRFHGVVRLNINQMVNTMLVRETFPLAVSVFFHLSCGVARHADVERAVSFAGENVNAGLFHEGHYGA